MTPSFCTFSIRRISTPSFVGSDDFVKTRSLSNSYLDKSMLIRDLISGSDDVSLVTMPRRWGKSLNMDMVKKFLEIEVDEKGNRLPEEERVNRKLFAGGTIDLWNGEKKKLEPLKISKYESIMKIQGTFPVISISFKNICSGNYKDLEYDVRTEMLNLYKEHEYLLHSPVLSKCDKETIQSHLSENTTLSQLKSGLKFLSTSLESHFGRKVWVLIDEYDSPINNSFVYFGTLPDNPTMFTEEFQSVIRLFRGLLGSALKGNHSLERGFVTGILRIAKADLFSSVNNFGEYSLLSKKFSCHYGISQEELDDLLKRVEVEPSIVDGLKYWYNGYDIGGRVVYNPWSLMKSIANGELGNYWLESGGLGLIEKTIIDDSTQEDLQRLLTDKGGITLKITNQINLSTLHQKSSLFSLLLFAGYLNPTPIKGKSSFYKLTIPNMEVREIYEEKILLWVSNKLNRDPSDLCTLSDLLERGDLETFEKELKDFLISSTSFLHVKGKGEIFYNALMLGIVSDLRYFYHIESDRESGLGRADLILIPKDESNHRAMIIEYKCVKGDNISASKLDEEASRGLSQIENNRYDATVKRYSYVREILKVGLAFCGKDVEVRYEKEKINLSGNGEGNDDSHIFAYDKFFNRYYSDAINTLLQLRIPKMDFTAVLKAKYSSESIDSIDDSLLKDLFYAFHCGANRVLVPYNLLNKHWLGLVFEKSDDSLTVNVLDPEHGSRSNEFTNLLERVLQDSFSPMVDVNKINIDPQIGGNCGPEMVENFHCYLTGIRYPENEAVWEHSKLFESFLLDSYEQDNFA